MNFVFYTAGASMPLVKAGTARRLPLQRQTLPHVCAWRRPPGPKGYRYPRGRAQKAKPASDRCGSRGPLPITPNNVRR